MYEHFLETGRFYVALGNHDYRQPNAQPARDFLGPDNPYVLRVGNVELFAIDSNECVGGEEDGDGGATPPETSLQDQRAALVNALNASTACWKVVFMHHPAYSKGRPQHSNVCPEVRQFLERVNDEVDPGHEIDVVLAGHIHALEYSRAKHTKAGSGLEFQVDYVVSGGGGAPLHGLGKPDSPAVAEWGSKDFGFPILTFCQPPLFPKHELFTHFRVTRPQFPSRHNWFERWLTGTAHFGHKEKAADDCTATECQRLGQCYPATQLKVGSWVKETCPWYWTCGAGQVVSTRPRPSCPEEHQLMTVDIQASICCDGPGASCVHTGCCPFIAVGYECGTGRPVASVCLNQYTYSTVRGHLHCAFDRFNLPCTWAVYAAATTYKVTCPISIDYHCCGCTGVYQ